jgi:glutathione S-transferase
VKLYSTNISNNGKRVRIAAAELGIALEQVPFDFAKGDARSPEYLKISPAGKVPALTDGDFSLFESNAILWYLAAQSESNPLRPAHDARSESDTLRWMFYGASHLDPHIGMLITERFIKARRQLQPDEHLVAHAVGQLGRFVPVIEQQLAGHEYLTGKFGLADVSLGCTLEIGPVLGYDLSPYPNVRAWLARLAARPSWR